MTALHGRRILFAVPPARFDEAQLYQTWQILADDGAWLVLGCDSSTGVAVGEGGTVARATRALRDAVPANFDAVVFIAGDWGRECLEVAARFASAGVPVAAFKGVKVKANVVGTLERLPRLLAELAVAVSKRPRAAAQIPAQI